MISKKRKAMLDGDGQRLPPEHLQAVKEKPRDPIKRAIEPISMDDDVAGLFFADEVAAFLGEDEQPAGEEAKGGKAAGGKKAGVGAKAAAAGGAAAASAGEGIAAAGGEGVSSDKGRLAKPVMPGRKAGFKGVASAAAAALLEEGF